MREVVVTGVGLRTPLGHTLEDLQASFREGRSAVRSLPSKGKPRLGALIDHDFAADLSVKERALQDRNTGMAVAASDDAIAHAGLDISALDPVRAGIYIGSGVGPSHSLMETYGGHLLHDRIGATMLLKCLHNAPASYLAARHGFRGITSTQAVACASSTLAIGEAVRAIRAGYLDTALAGGTESPFGEVTFRAWEVMRVLARPGPDGDAARACRPFAKGRTGMVLGEGAVIFVLEDAEQARARGAPVLATVAGYGQASGLTGVAVPDEEAEVLAMQSALRDAGLLPGDIGYINAHGTATALSDATEVRAVKRVFGADASNVAISSTKSMHGHLLGASGALEMAAAMLAMRTGWLPPTAHLDESDPDCDLDHVPHRAREVAQPPRAVMSNSFAFGGSNACLVLT